METNRFRTCLSTVAIAALSLVVALTLVSCGSSSSPSSGMGSATVTMSDPPSSTTFSHVWVTIDDVSATISSSDSGWVPLVSQLSSTSGAIKAVQVDLLNLPANGQCLLAQLGSTQSLPAGDYGQIRLQLVANNTAASGVTLLSPSGESTTNQCGNAWNCVVDVSGTTTLDLSSEAQTGLKIPPGQVMGGPIHVAAGASVDINIDFNADRSIVDEGNAQFRLMPVLLAYQSTPSTNTTGISGQVVQGTVAGSALTVTTNPVPNANVALEMSTGNPADGTSSVDLIGNYLKAADANGNFDFCPLPAGPFDVVVNAGAGGSTTGNYNATIITGVPNGTKVTVPVVAEVGGPATLSGLVTATPASASATSVSADVYALQAATNSLEFAVPLLSGSNPALAQVSVPCTGGSCTTAAPVFSLVVPASNPLVGSFSTSGINWTVSTATTVNYKVEATCTGGSGTVASFSTPPSMVTAATTTTLPAGQPPSLSGCQ